HSLLAAGEAQRAIRHDPLGVGYVSDDLFDAPLTRLIAEQCVRVRERAKHGARRGRLLVEYLDQVAVGDSRDVPVEVLRVLAFLGTRDAGISHRSSSSKRA